MALFMLPLLLGCPVYDKSYHVYYDGNDNTEGYPPVDSNVYFAKDTAVILERPEGLKKGTLKFLGWRRAGVETPLWPGGSIEIGYEDVWLYAWWEDDPNHVPYEYADHPDPAIGGVIITKYYTTHNWTISLPSTLDDKPVTAIGEGVFADMYFDKITLPSQLKIIGNKAFAGSYINKIAIPDTVTTIGKLAFQKASLETVTLGSGLEFIGDYAFDNNHLAVLFLPAATKSVGEGAFYGNDIVSIEIGALVTIANETSMGIHGASFRKYYHEKDSADGVYLYNTSRGVWQGPYKTNN
jgi:hypothetical protein